MRRVLWINAQLTIVWSLKHHSMHPTYLNFQQKKIPRIVKIGRFRIQKRLFPFLHWQTKSRHLEQCLSSMLSLNSCLRKNGPRLLVWDQLHCVLRVLKSSLWDPRGQTYVFQSKIARGIQNGVQNNQLLSLPSTIFFKNYFQHQKLVILAHLGAFFSKILNNFYVNKSALPVFGTIL